MKDDFYGMAPEDVLSVKRRDEIRSELSGFRENQEFVIAFCGIFSSGKSSLINAILQDKFKLPVGIEPVTGCLTRIRYGTCFRAYCMQEETPVFLTEAEALEIIKGKRRLPVPGVELILELPSELLKQGVVILDTPGYCEEETEDRATHDAVSEADLAVFCTCAAVFGKAYEQACMERLADTPGNFCVVVNRLDSIHSQEDFDKLKAYVKNTVKNRGKTVLGRIWDKTIFYTVASGPYTHLDMLDQYLFGLCTQQDEKELLKKSAFQRRTSRRLENMTAEIEKRVASGRKLRAKSEAASAEKYEKELELYRRKCRQIDSEISDMRLEWKTHLDQTSASIRGKLLEIEKTGEWRTFQADAAKEIRAGFLASAEYFWSWHAKFRPGSQQSWERFPIEFMDCVNAYRVPRPTGERVRTRGIAGRAMVTAVHFVFGSRELDDGYEMVYRGYAGAAYTHMEKSLIPKLQKIMEQFLDGVAAASRPGEPEKETDETDRISACLMQWEQLKKDVARAGTEGTVKQ